MATKFYLTRASTHRREVVGSILGQNSVKDMKDVSDVQH